MTMKQTKNPIKAPPVVIKANWIMACGNEKEPAINATKAKRKNIKAAASLIKLSPSKTVMIRRGASNFLMILVAAEASVGEMIAPNKNASGQVKSTKMHFATTATTHMVKATKPN